LKVKSLLLRRLKGIGKAISLRLAEEGADVVVNYQNTKEHATEGIKADRPDRYG